MITTFSFKLTWQEGDGYQVLCFHLDPQTSADLPLKHTHTHLNQISPPFRTQSHDSSLGDTKTKSVQF